MSKAEHRFPWIEACLRFAGIFGAREKKAYMERFCLTAGMASRDQQAFLRVFNRHCGKEAVRRVKGHLEPVIGVFPGTPVFTQPRMAQWLEDAMGPRFEIVPPIRRAEPSPAILQAVIRAIWDRHCLSMHYISRRGGESQRIISPHTILFAAERLHLRAWDHGRSAARDFVLSRILSAAPTNAASYVGIEHDRAWHQHVVLEICPGEGENVEALRLDYGLDKTGRAIRRVRKAHEIYLLSTGNSNIDLSHDAIQVTRRNPAS